MKIMLVAAEASGDALGAGLARALKARLGDGVAFVGIGGPRMAAEGVAGVRMASTWPQTLSKSSAMRRRTFSAFT